MDSGQPSCLSATRSTQHHAERTFFCVQLIEGGANYYSSGVGTPTTTTECTSVNMVSGVASLSPWTVSSYTYWLT